MWHTLSTKEVEKKISTNIEYGLREKEVNERKEKYGKNQLEEKKKESIFIKFIKQFNDFMIIILICASIISAIVTKFEGSNDYFDSIIIIAIVVFNAIMGLIQEAKAEKSLEALKKMSAPTCKVKRNGQILTINGEDIVVGDIVLLEAGNFVPADCRLISSSNLKIEESSLTGETVPILKNAEDILNEKTVLGDMTNMAFATTIVVNRTWRSNSNRYWNEYKSRKNCKTNNNKRITRNSNSKKVRRSRKNFRNSMFSNLLFDFYYRNF